jgi:hypothetical protein
MAHEDLFDHVEGMRKAGEQIPEPRSLEQIKASWKDWPLWKDSDYITVPIDLIPNDTKSHIMINSSPLRLDRATRNRDGHRDGEPSILKNDDCKEHIYIYRGDYCTMRLWAFLIRNSADTIGERMQYYMTCVIEFAESKSMGEKGAFDYLYAHKGIEYLHEHYDVEHRLSPEDAVKDLTEVCGNNGGNIT